jgi:hypothetical protein
VGDSLENVVQNDEESKTEYRRVEEEPELPCGSPGVDKCNIVKLVKASIMFFGLFTYHTQEQFYCLGVKVCSGLFADIGQHFFFGPVLPIWAVGAQGIPYILLLQGRRPGGEGRAGDRLHYTEILPCL